MPKHLTDTHVAVLGLGAMGSALVRGWLTTGTLTGSQITAYDVDAGRLAAGAAELGIEAAPNAGAAAAKATVVLLAVKPQDALAAAQEAYRGLRPSRSGAPLLLSIAAGLTVAKLEQAVADVPVIRVMPNTPALVGAGASAFSRGKLAGDAQAETAMALLSAVGLAYEVKESLLNAVTGLSGSGPAYLYLAIEALADGGVRNGLPRDVAQSLAAQTVLGAAKMVLETGEHPGQLKDRVTSPGGTTIAALATLEAAGFRSALIEAVTVAAKRAGELG